MLILPIDELFDENVRDQCERELIRIVHNLYSPDYPSQKERKLEIVFAFSTDEKRGSVVVTAAVNSKLPSSPFKLTKICNLQVDDDGVVLAVEKTKEAPGQMDLMGNEVRPKVVPLGRCTGQENEE